MQLVFIHGPAACGKLTVAEEVVARTGHRLFHNHLTVDLCAALFDFGTPPFVALREAVWMRAFAEAAQADQSLVFTFHPESSVAGDFPARAASQVEASGGEVVFVELVCPEAEIERRIESESRAAFGKLRSLDEYRRLRDAGAFAFPPLPAARIVIDTAEHGPAAAAERIAAVL